MIEYISKERAMSAIRTVWSESEGNAGLLDYLAAIENEPPADVKPVVRAEWVKNDDGWYNCSNCGNEMFFTGVYDDNQQYCYFCGADMRGADE